MALHPLPLAEIRHGVVSSDLHEALTFGAVPPELYLRDARSLDLDDDQALLGFIREYGITDLTVGIGGDVPYLRELSTRYSRPQLASWKGKFPDLLRAGAIHLLYVRKFYPQGGGICEPLATARIALRWIRDLTTIVLELDDLDGGPSRWESTWVPRPESRTKALLVLEGGLEALLRPFSPRLRIVEESRGDVDTPIFHAPLVSLLAMQLYNHLAEQAPFRTCANEQCGQRFVTHQGRAVHGQNKRAGGGVKYCSYTCSRAQATRNYRKRQKDKEAAT